MGKDSFFFNYYTHISFSLILAGISFSLILAGMLRAGKTRFLGNQAVCRMRSAKIIAQHMRTANRPSFSAGKHQLAYPDGSSTTYLFFM